jgi:glyoxylase-like metal-dependent hydrolase (beta-lactamase superfamily II)
VAIKRVVAPNPGPMTLTGTNTYLISDSSGNLAAVDPGPDDLPQHLDAILSAAAEMGTLTTVLVTHRHLDHLPAAVPLCQRTGAQLVGHKDLPGVQRAVADDEPVFGSLRALETPGHTRESLCFWDAQANILFTGDLVAGAGTVVVDDQPGALSDYLASLERLLTLQPRTIYPGHGPIVEDGPAKLQEYLDHRRQRVQQVIDALASRGPSTVDELVATIYPDVASNLVAPAGRNVSANLELLADQGKVAAAAGARWQLRPAEFCALERQLIASMAMRKKRHIKIEPVQQLKVRLLEYVEAADPGPGAFTGTLAEAVIAVSEGPATGPAQAVASDLQMDWNLACSSLGFVTWLRQAAARGSSPNG